MSVEDDTLRVSREMREAFLEVMERNAETQVDKAGIAGTLARVAGAMIKGAPQEIIQQTVRDLLGGAGCDVINLKTEPLH